MKNKEIRDFIVKYLFVDEKENDKITISLTGCIRMCEAYYNYKNKTKQHVNKNQNKYDKRFYSEQFIMDLYPDKPDDKYIYFNKDFTESYLGDNKLTILPDTIGNLSQLKLLWLYNNKLNTLPDTIGNLSQLKELYLGDNNLTTLPDTIGNLSQLNILYLDNNNLTTLPDTIGNLSQLTYLSLYNNRLSKQEQQKIKRLLPNTEIIF